MQLVQVAHRRSDERWTERPELTTDDLGRMLWDRLLQSGPAAETGRVTCEWGWHPRQRHKSMREPWGGLNPYRSRYGVPEPLRFHSTVGHLHDEVQHYRRFRDRAPTPRAENGLRVLLVGELAHNPERILALSERGHELFGPTPRCGSTPLALCPSATSPRFPGKAGGRRCPGCSRMSSTPC
ncbi:MAG TPA: hypothetical protein VEU28_03900 [Actinomycetota bacterium]|nr:hypothetical protein [Actinomycetota bacterium]